MSSPLVRLIGCVEYRLETAAKFIAVGLLESGRTRLLLLVGRRAGRVLPRRRAPHGRRLPSRGDDARCRLLGRVPRRRKRPIAALLPGCELDTFSDRRSTAE